MPSSGSITPVMVSSKHTPFLFINSLRELPSQRGLTLDIGLRDVSGNGRLALHMSRRAVISLWPTHCVVGNRVSTPSLLSSWWPCRSGLGRETRAGSKAG